MAATPMLIAQRNHEKAFLLKLNDRFQQYVTTVRSLRDQSKKVENSTFVAHTQALENEIFDLKSIYEGEIENLRYQLDVTTSEKNELQIQASKGNTQLTELKTKYDDEANFRKKSEGALADAHRLLGEKDSLIQELRISIAQYQKANTEVVKERDNLQNSLSSVQALCDNETKARVDLQSSLQKASDQINFERQIHTKEVAELCNKISAAERAIAIADDQLKEHDNLGESLAKTMSQIRLQRQAEFQRYQEDSEKAYQQSIDQIKDQLEKESCSLASALEENIHLKANVEELNAMVAKVDAKCAALNEQNRVLIRNMEAERQQAAEAIRNLKGDLRREQESSNAMNRELNIAYNASIPLDYDIETLTTLMDAETKRVSVALSNLPSEAVQTTPGELLSSRNHYTANRSLPGSPRKPVTGINTSVAPLAPLSARSKAIRSAADNQAITMTDVPATTTATTSSAKYNGGYFPSVGPTSGVFKNHRSGSTGSPTSHAYYRKSSGGV